MDFYVFQCAAHENVQIITADPDPANIPPDAMNLCDEWILVDQFKKGDGPYPPQLEAFIEQQIKDNGYYPVPSGSPT